jgi:hypothetical protein
MEVQDGGKCLWIAELSQLHSRLAYWEIEQQNKHFAALGRVRSSPAVTGGVVYVGSMDGNLEESHHS